MALQPGDTAPHLTADTNPICTTERGSMARLKPGQPGR